MRSRLDGAYLMEMRSLVNCGATGLISRKGTVSNRSYLSTKQCYEDECDDAISRVPCERRADWRTFTNLLLGTPVHIDISQIT